MVTSAPHRWRVGTGLLGIGIEGATRIELAQEAGVRLGVLDTSDHLPARIEVAAAPILWIMVVAVGPAFRFQIALVHESVRAISRAPIS
jgi:hypothetical protein